MSRDGLVEVEPGLLERGEAVLGDGDLEMEEVVGVGWGSEGKKSGG